MTTFPQCWFKATIAVLQDLKTTAEQPPLSNDDDEGTADLNLQMRTLFKQLQDNRQRFGNKQLAADVALLQNALKSGQVTPDWRKQTWITILAGVDNLCEENQYLADWAIRLMKCQQQSKQQSSADKPVELSLPPLDEYFLFAEAVDTILSKCVADETLGLCTPHAIRIAKVVMLPICYIVNDVHYAAELFRLTWRRLYLRMLPLQKPRGSVYDSDEMKNTLYLSRILLREICPEEVFYLECLGTPDLVEHWFRRWITCCFVGYFPVTQVLHCWDLAIAYQSMSVFALVCVAIVAVKRQSILNEVSDADDLEAVLQHTVNIDVRKLVFALVQTDDIQSFIRKYSQNTKV